MTIKEIDEFLLWNNPDDYDDVGYSPEYKCIDLTEWRDTEVSSNILDRVKADLEKLDKDTEILIKLAVNNMIDYSTASVYIGDKGCTVTIKSSVNGSTLKGRSTVEEFLELLNIKNYSLDKINYKNFWHIECDKEIVENNFGELEGGYGEYELVDIDCDEELSEEEKDQLSDMTDIDDRCTLGIDFQGVDDIVIYIETNLLKEKNIIYQK
jgi:hypothetical protein